MNAFKQLRTMFYMGTNWTTILIVLAAGYVFFNYTSVGQNLSNQFLQRTGIALGSGKGNAGQPGSVGLF
jgi:hypothetical protein